MCEWIVTIRFACHLYVLYPKGIDMLSGTFPARDLRVVKPFYSRA